MTSLALMLGLGVAGAGVELHFGKDAVKAQRERIEDQKKAAFARAESNYKAARRRCERGAAAAQKTCLQQAHDKREADIRQARIETARALNELQAKLNDRAPPAPAPPSVQERYLAAKARCDLQGPDRDRCLANVKQRFGKS